MGYGALTGLTQGGKDGDVVALGAKFTFETQLPWVGEETGTLVLTRAQAPLPMPFDRILGAQSCW